MCALAVTLPHLQASHVKRFLTSPSSVLVNVGDIAIVSPINQSRSIISSSSSFILYGRPYITGSSSQTQLSRTESSLMQLSQIDSPTSAAAAPTFSRIGRSFSSRILPAPTVVGRQGQEMDRLWPHAFKPDLSPFKFKSNHTSVRTVSSITSLTAIAFALAAWELVRVTFQNSEDASSQHADSTDLAIAVATVVCALVVIITQACNIKRTLLLRLLYLFEFWFGVSNILLLLATGCIILRRSACAIVVWTNVCAMLSMLLCADSIYEHPYARLVTHMIAAVWLSLSLFVIYAGVFDNSDYFFTIFYSPTSTLALLENRIFTIISFSLKDIVYLVSNPSYFTQITSPVSVCVPVDVLSTGTPVVPVLSSPSSPSSPSPPLVSATATLPSETVLVLTASPVLTELVIDNNVCFARLFRISPECVPVYHRRLFMSALSPFLFGAGISIALVAIFVPNCAYLNYVVLVLTSYPYAVRFLFFHPDIVLLLFRSFEVWYLLFNTLSALATISVLLANESIIAWAALAIGIISTVFADALKQTRARSVPSMLMCVMWTCGFVLTYRFARIIDIPDKVLTIWGRRLSLIEFFVEKMTVLSIFFIRVVYCWFAHPQRFQYIRSRVKVVETESESVYLSPQHM